MTAADILAGQTCYDTVTLLPNVVPLLAAVPATGCGQDIIVSPLSTLLAVGAPYGLTGDGVKARFCHFTAYGTRSHPHNLGRQTCAICTWAQVMCCHELPHDFALTTQPIC